jgi:hypothetical protein
VEHPVPDADECCQSNRRGGDGRQDSGEEPQPYDYWTVPRIRCGYQQRRKEGRRKNETRRRAWKSERTRDTRRPGSDRERDRVEQCIRERPRDDERTDVEGSDHNKPRENPRRAAANRNWLHFDEIGPALESRTNCQGHYDVQRKQRTG